MPTALVTGATEGIGRAIAFALGAAGYRVGICARTPSRLRPELESLQAAGFTAAAAPCDVGVEADVKTAVRDLAAELGPIDTLVNNAGVAILKPFLELSVEDWDTTMATNLRSMFLVTREVLPGMRERSACNIVNIASIAAQEGFDGGTAYHA